MLHLDLDQFKIVNDACGRDGAARAEWELCSRRRSAGATRLASSAVTSSASCSRSCTFDEALRTAETLRSAINDFKFTWDGGALRWLRAQASGVVRDHASDRRRRHAIDCRRMAHAPPHDTGRNRIYS